MMQQSWTPILVALLTTTSFFSGCTSKREVTEVPHLPDYQLKFGESGNSIVKRLGIREKDTVRTPSDLLGAAMFLKGDGKMLGLPLLSLEFSFEKSALTQVAANLGLPNKLGSIRYFNEALGTAVVDYYEHVEAHEDFVENYRAGDRRTIKSAPEKFTQASMVWHDDKVTFVAQSPAPLLKSKDVELMGQVKLRMYFDPEEKILKQRRESKEIAIKLGIAR